MLVQFLPFYVYIFPQILQAKAKREKDKYSPEYEYLRAESAKYYVDTPFSAELKDADYDYIDEAEDNIKL